MSDPIPDVPVKSARRSIWSRVSIVWLVPIVALLIALGLAWQNYSERGPLIEIVFDDASGIRANETQLRYRDVAVGIVEKVGFTDDLDQVVVSVRVDKGVAPYVDSSAQFWVVRPEVTTQGVTGLDTVLSGVYLQGLWDRTPGTAQHDFQGLASAPLLPTGEQGLRVTLRSRDQTLTGNSPIIYKGVEVGRVGPASVSTDGTTVEAEAVIFAPHDALVTETTRFWNSSGFSVSLGPSGAALNFGSLATLIAGGVTFDTFVTGAALAQNGTDFDVYADNASARASVFSHEDGQPVNLVAVFEGNITGLTVGAAVELEGLRIGEVSGINGYIDAARFGDDSLRLQTIISIQPARLGLEGDSSSMETMAYLQNQVENGGLRARLVTGSLFTGGLKVQLLRTDDRSGQINMDAQPYPEIPTVASQITDAADTVQGTLDRFNDLPIEELMQSAVSFLDNASSLVGSAQTQAIPGEVMNLLGDARTLTASPEVQALPGQVGQTMAGITAAVGDLQAVIADLRQADAVNRIVDAIDNVQQVAGEIGEGFEGMPGLVQSIDDLATQWQSLPLEGVVTQAESLLATADSVLGDPRTRQLPADLSGALNSLQAVLDEARGGNLVGNANDALAAASRAADQLAAATNDLPALSQRLNALVTQAGGTLSGFDQNATMMRDLSLALRQINTAASAITDLARALERRPNSILFGR
ncbi:paraquat-inducible protein B [Ketogulonicigenium robustum]|uniref:Paraquat-inducible protein B n=1 Tax=Ketogulonicigenium robustum TaxID=92947 RepID=A0A1W6P1S2_9RHOB|nr:MlaD family protein [Ketogulonicigenium robustum]ARO15341.1 paraquat-inducible protein B [Ketogulonicigenium robustum]